MTAMTKVATVAAVILLFISSLAGCAHLSSVREDAFRAAMRADLRNAWLLQEMHFADHFVYASDLRNLEFVSSRDVIVEVVSADEQGFALRATHARTTMTCGFAVGSFANPVDPAAPESEIACRR